MHRTEKLRKNLARFIIIASTALLLTLCVITFLQVFFRYVLNNALYWSEEAVRYAFVWITFIGFNLVVVKKTEMGVSFFSDFLPEKMRRIVDIASLSLILLFLGVFVWEGFVLALESTFILTIALQMPWTYVYLAAPTGGVFMILLYALRVVDICLGPESSGGEGKAQSCADEGRGAL